jgi:hypothetical protein
VFCKINHKKTAKKAFVIDKFYDKVKLFFKPVKKNIVGFIVMNKEFTSL